MTNLKGFHVCPKDFSLMCASAQTYNPVFRLFSQGIRKSVQKPEDSRTSPKAPLVAHETSKRFVDEQ